MLKRLEPRDHLEPQDIEAGLRAILRDGLCSQTMGTLTTGVILVGFAVALGADNLYIGVLAAIPFLMHLIQLPTILLVERLRRRKTIVIGINVFGRTTLLGLALIPLLPERDVQLAALAGGMLVHGACNAVSAGAWNSWMRDLVPQHRLGSYFGQRLFLATAAAAVLMLAAGLGIDAWKAAAPAAAVWAYSVLFAVGGLAGLTGLYFLLITPEPRMPAVEVPMRFGALLAQPFRDLNFRRLILFLGSWNFAVNLAAPFFAVYMLRRLGFEMSLVATVTVISQAANLLVLRTFGTLSDRFSNKSVLAVCGPLFIACIFAWTFTTLPERHTGTVPLLIVIHVLMGFATAGVTLASSTIAMKMAPAGQATPYLASTSLINSVAAGLAPVIGGLLADFFASREFAVTLHYVGVDRIVAVEALSFRHWDFLFLLATVIGLYSIHRLSLVAEKGHVKERVVLQALVLEARRAIKNLSTVGGLRAPATFPWALLRREKRGGASRPADKERPPPQDAEHG